MSSPLVRFDLTLSRYFGYPPAPSVGTRAMIPRRESEALFMRGEYGIKEDGRLRPISSHGTTHLDVPLHFYAEGSDVAGVLNNAAWPGDRPSLARVVSLFPGTAADGQSAPGRFSRDGVSYCEAVSAELLPDPEILAGYEALVILTGFGALMNAEREEGFAPADSQGYHVPYLTEGAVERILAAGLRLVAIDSTTVEPQTSAEPVRFGSAVHFSLLGASPPVLIVEGLDGSKIGEQAGFVPSEGLLHVVPRRVNAVGGEAAHSRVFLYCFRQDPEGRALRALLKCMTPEEYYG